MSAKKNLRNNLDVLEDLTAWEHVEVRIRRVRATGFVRVAIGSRGDGFISGEGSNIPVALDRALKAYRDDFYERLDEDPAESTDRTVILLEGL